MTSTDPIALLKAIADPSRLKLIKALRQGPQCLEELAQRLGLAPSTVSFHMKKLEQAEWVFKVKEQYYTVYTLNGDRLNLRLGELIQENMQEENAQQQRLHAHRQRVIDAFFKGARLRQLPVQNKKRRLVLNVFASDFEVGRAYTENEVNTLIQRRFDDYCLIRRLLVDAGDMERSDGIYRLTKTPHAAPLHTSKRQSETTMKDTDRKKELKAQYKMRQKTAGVWKITCQANGRFLMGSNLDMHAPFNRHRAMLTLGSHRNKALQDDWNTHGPEAFTFEILEAVQEKYETGFSLSRELEAMEEKWIDALTPLADQGYNEHGRLSQ